MGFIPQSLLVASAVATHTSKIRVGTNISLIGLKHPMQVVEEFHSLDVISGGRAIAGVGLGYQAQDFSMFGRDVKNRVSLYEDALSVMRLAREGDAISFKGRHCAIDNVKIVPKPMQSGGVPILMGTLSTAGIDRIVRMGDGLICGAIDDLVGLRKLVGKYTELATNAEKPFGVTLNRFAAVHNTNAEARAVLEPHALKALRYYFRHLHEMGDATPASLKAAQSSGAAVADLTFEHFEEFFVCGTAAECIARIQLLRQDLRLERIVLQIRSAGGPSHEATLDQIRRFGADVIPHFR
jgi:alkanesulfonate monooxygenase SsuD/methylene tetrahydromethanopterin reductase-like flavin-dependent oxidoreductase (luciferase family)